MIEKSIDHRFALMGALLNSVGGNATTQKGKDNSAAVIEMAKKHVATLDNDPVFYSHLAAWYMKNGEVRDHQEMFIVYLLLSDPLHDLRKHGVAMLLSLPAFRIARVVRLLKRHAKKTPRIVRSAVTKLLRDMESKTVWFDSTALRSAADLKYLYAINHIAPSPRANKILFKQIKVEGGLKETIGKLKDMHPVQAAATIIEKKIPYQVVLSVIEPITLQVAIAMIKNMSPVEVINNLVMLEKHGAFKSDTASSLIKEKITLAAGAKGVDPLKMSLALKKIQGTDMEGAVKVAQQAKMDSKGRLTGKILFCVDRSPSQQRAIALSKRIAGIIANQADDFMCVAFDGTAMEVKPMGEGYAGWEKAFEMMNIGTATSCGSPIAYAYKKGFKADKVIMVTDEGDNTGPMFKTVWPTYAEYAGNPELFIIQIEGGYGLENHCFNAANSCGTTVSRIPYKSDSYQGAMGIISFLKGEGKADLINEIMDTPLPI